eukprot:6475566-Amphidinium_carterae.4
MQHLGRAVQAVAVEEQDEVTVCAGGTQRPSQQGVNLDQVYWDAAEAGPPCCNGPLLHLWHQGACGLQAAGRVHVLPPTTLVHVQASS